jgi:hypothetical protein
MTIHEYEERFRPKAPSLHQIFVETERSNRRLRSKQAFLLAASLLSVIVVLLEAAAHLRADNHTNAAPLCTLCAARASTSTT